VAPNEPPRSRAEECTCRLLRRESPPESPEVALEVLVRGHAPDRRTFWICRCCECGQPFLRLRVVVNPADPSLPPAEWNYWAPLEPGEAERLRDHPEEAEALVRSRPRIVATPEGRLYWDLEISRPHEPGTG